MDLKINYKAFNVNGLSIFYLTVYFIINIIKNSCFIPETAVMYLSTI